MARGKAGWPEHDPGTVWIGKAKRRAVPSPPAGPRLSAEPQAFPFVAGTKRKKKKKNARQTAIAAPIRTPRGRTDAITDSELAPK